MVDVDSSHGWSHTPEGRRVSEVKGPEKEAQITSTTLSKLPAGLRRFMARDGLRWVGFGQAPGALNEELAAWDPWMP